MIPVNEPDLGAKELRYVADCVQSGWVSSAGPYIDRFEQGWASRCDRRHGIAVSNGTAALQLAIACLGLEDGDEVLLPSFTIISCALAVVYNGCTPLLVDADPKTWCMDPDALESKITPRTRAVMPVHIYGHPADMDPLLDIAERHDLKVIEDAAEAHGATYLSRRHGSRWLPCGSMGDLSCFSFYANKLVTTGEGGMVVTDDDALATRARSLRNLAFSPERRFVHDDLGFNFRLTNVQAALGLGQIERFEDIVAKKQWIGRSYSEALASVDGLILPPDEKWARNVFWMYGVVLDDRVDMSAEAFAKELADRGIETRPFFVGMHRQPALKRLGLFEGESYPVTDRLSERGLYLPSGLALTQDQIDRVVSAITEVLL